MGGFLFFRRRDHWRSIRHEILKKNLGRALRRTGFYLVAVLSLHVLALIVFEDMAFFDAVWLTLTTVTTVGYGDHSAQTVWGRLATILLIYVGAIFVLFQAAADYFEYRMTRQTKMIRGRWSWRMKDHILILGAPEINPVSYFQKLIAEFRHTPQFAERPVLLVSPDFPEGLPDRLQELGLVHVHGDPTDPQALAKASVPHASAIMVLAEKATNPRSDAATFDTLHRLRDIGHQAVVLAESVRDTNKERLRQAGAQLVLRPIRFYPEIVVRGFICPGSEIVLEDLFSGRGHECHGYAINLRARRWADIVNRVVEAGIGTAIGYRARADDSIHTNPPAGEPVDATALFLIVDEGAIPTETHLRERLAEICVAHGDQLDLEPAES